MPLISKEIIDEIKTQNDIVDVIGSYISLNDKNKALCPFHNDKNPSFSVHKDKQWFKCFSCGESGNVITFVEKYEHCTYPEALKKLADRVGIKIDIGSTNKIRDDLKKYYEVNSIVNNYFKNLLLSSDGKEALIYLEDRGLTKELISEFNIGCSPGNNKLYEGLKKKYPIELLEESDIVKERNDKVYDSFQNRIIFPILDEYSNVIGFSGRKYLKRDLDNDELPKYYNTRETKTFIKSNIMYNINNAKEHIIKKKEIIITEGFMDTIRLSSIGYKNVIALMGTAFTPSHLEKILKYKCRVVLNLDQDNPGKVNTISIGEELERHGIESSVIVFDDYKDSDEFINKKGKDAFDIAYNNRIPFIDFKLKYLKNSRNMKDTSDVSKYINDAIKSINEIKDDILKELKIKELAKEFDLDESIIKSKINVSSKKNEEVKESTHVSLNKYDISEIRILYLMLNYDDIITVFENHLGTLIHENMSYLAYKIMEFRNDYDYFNISDFMDYIKDNEKLQSALSIVMKYPNNEDYTEKELNAYVKTIKEYSVERRRDALRRELAETMDVNKQIEIAKKLNDIKKEVLEW